MEAVAAEAWNWNIFPASEWQHCVMCGLSGLEGNFSQEQSPRTKALPWRGLARGQHLLGTPGCQAKDGNTGFRPPAQVGWGLLISCQD